MIKEEFIGKKAEVLYNTENFAGVIVNETKNMIWIETKNGVKKIIKKNAIIKFQDKKISGKKITKRPHERIKLKN